MSVSSQTIDLALVENWLREAGEIALSRRKMLEISAKPDNTLVTDVDWQIEKFLVDNIIRSYPGHQVLAEETGIHGSTSEFLWAVDPIDGTRAFASGLPLWGISIGVLYRGEPYAGGLYLPAVGEIYLGSADGAFFNDQLLRSNKNTDIKNPMAFLAVPSNAHRLYEISFPRLRSLGSTTVHLVYVARGIATATLTRRIRIWDIAAVLPILSAVGIGLVYLSGKPFQINDVLGGELSPEPIVAAPISVLEEIRLTIQFKAGIFLE